MAPVGLGARGRRLWRELATAATPPAQRVLMEEACRIADRLERLDALLREHPEAWEALREARQQAGALRQLVAEIRQSGVGVQSGPAKGGSSRDDLAARRKARLADAAGR